MKPCRSLRRPLFSHHGGRPAAPAEAEGVKNEVEDPFSLGDEDEEAGEVCSLAVDNAASKDLRTLGLVIDNSRDAAGLTPPHHRDGGKALHDCKNVKPAAHASH